MPEKIHTITAGSREVYELVESEDGLYLTIRDAANHDHQIRLTSSVVPILIQALKKSAFRNTGGGVEMAF